MPTEIGYGVIPVTLGDAGLSNSVARIQGMLTSKFGKTGKVVGSALTVGIAGAVAAGVGLYKIGKTFDDMSDTIVQRTGASGKALKSLENTALAVGKNTPSNFHDVGEAVAGLNQRLGLTGKPLQQTASNILNLSRITGTDLKTNIAASARLFKDWSIPTAKQAVTLDKLYVASQKTGIGVDDLSQMMVKFGSPLRMLGLNFDYSAAMLANFEKSGVNMQTTMPGLRMALKNFAEAGKDPAKALTQTFDAMKNAKTKTEATSIAFKVFGARAGPDMAAAVREGRFNLDGLIKTIQGSKGAISDADKRTRDFSETWQIIKNRVMIPLKPLAEKLFAAIGQGAARFAAALPGIIKTVQNIAGPIFATFKAIGGGIDKLFGGNGNSMKVFAAALGVVVAALGAYKIGIVASSIATKVWAVASNIATAASSVWAAAMWVVNDACIVTRVQLVALKIQTIAIGVAQKVAAVASKVWAAGQWLLNAALNANPIGLIVMAVAALIAVIVLAWKHSETFRKIVIGAWNGIKTALTAVVNFLKTVFTAAWSGIKTAVSAVWNGIKTVVSTAAKFIVNVIRVEWAILKAVVTGVWNGIKTVVSAVWNGIKTVVSAAVKFVVTIIKVQWAVLKTVVTAVWNGIKTVVSAVWTGIKNVVSAAAKWVGDRVKTAWNNLKAVVSTLWNGIKTVITGVWNAIKNVVQAAAKWVADRVKTAWNNLKSNVQAVWNAIKTVITNVWNGIKTLVSNAATWVKTRVQTAWNNVKTITSNVWNAIKTAINNVWNAVKNIVNNAATWVKTRVQTAWNNVKTITSNVWTAIKNAINNVWNTIKNIASNAASWVRERVANAWNTIRTTTANVWGRVRDTLSGIWDRIKTGVQNFVSAFGRFWDGIKRAAAQPVNFIINTVWNNGIRKVLNLIPGVNIGAAKPISLARGGAINGGRVGKDSVPALLMPGEHVLTAKEVKLLGGQKRVYDLRQNIADGRLGKRDLAAMGDTYLPNSRRLAMALGGAVVTRARNFARAQAGKPYVWGGEGPGGWDCSGFMSGIANKIRGGSGYGVRYGTTNTMPWGGFKRGTGQFTIGNNQPAGHMAGTIGGLNAEATPPRVRVGSGARGGGYGVSYYLGAPGALGSGGGFVLPAWVSKAISAVKNFLGAVPKWMSTLSNSEWGRLFSKVLNEGITGVKKFFASKIPNIKDVIGAVGSALKSAAQTVGRWLGIGDAGGLINSGTGVLNTSGKPERLLSPRQTQMFDQLTQALVSSGGLVLAPTSSRLYAGARGGPPGVGAAAGGNSELVDEIRKLRGDLKRMPRDYQLAQRKGVRG